MSEKSTMLQGADGAFWLQTRATDGAMRLSYCGFIGRPDLVREWCRGKGIGFLIWKSGQDFKAITRAVGVEDLKPGVARYLAAPRELARAGH
jgi:hypothetical protein